MLSCVWLCNLMDCNPQGSSLHGILQARILESVAISSSGDIPIPEIEPVSPVSPALSGGFFTTDPPEKPIHVYVFCILADKVNILKLQG